MPSRAICRNASPTTPPANDRLNASFASPIVQFEQKTGAFVIAGPTPIGTVRIQAAGMRLTWAKRALERARYRVVDAQADILVREADQGWIISAGDRHANCGTYAQLVRSVQRLAAKENFG